MNKITIFSILFVLVFSIVFSGCISNKDNTMEKQLDQNKVVETNNSNTKVLDEMQTKEINPCDLISKTFAENVLNETLKDSELKDTFAPKGKSCIYITNKMIDNRKLELKLYQTDIVKAEGIFEDIQKYYNNLKNAKITASNLTINNLNYGNDSYFDGFDLHILIKDNYFIIHVDAGKITATSSQEMESKLASNRLELEKLVADEIIKNFTN